MIANSVLFWRKVADYKAVELINGVQNPVQFIAMA